MIAVITADLIDSTHYPQELFLKVLKTMNHEFEELEQSFGEQVKFKVYRGDSFQGIIHRLEDALQIAIQIKTAINRTYLDTKSTSRTYSKEADIRMAIGIGSVDFERDNILESNGQAFIFSGRTLDEMKDENRKIRLKTPQEDLNAEFNASLYVLDTLMDKWSISSAEVIYYLLKGMKETEIASILNISQSAVNQRKKAAGWEAVKVLLARYKNVVSKNFKNGE